MKVLVIGGTGTVGSRLVRRLLERGAEVRVLTRSPAAVRQRAEGAEYAAGDLANPATLPSAFQGAEKAYLLTPLHPREAELGLVAVRAAAEAGIRQLVFQSVHRVEAGSHLPHFRSKIDILRGIRDAGLPHTVISPSSFFQNDLHYRDAIVEHGVYPQPLGRTGVNRVDVRDIAHAAAVALLEEGHQGIDYPLVGPEAHTGEEAARIWSRHLGREVRYAGDDVDAWAEGARAVLPDWLVEDLRMMYAFLQEHGLPASEEELEAARRILGREPRSFDAFAAETAALLRT